PTVHPHACGEDAIIAASCNAPAGSPPRMWGRLPAFRQVKAQHRFTPTHVGKTVTNPTFSATHAVHPHACGEDGLQLLQHLRHHGSPPRMWGRLNGVKTSFGRNRFTPTHVGKTSSLACRARR